MADVSEWPYARLAEMLTLHSRLAAWGWSDQDAKWTEKSVPFTEGTARCLQDAVLALPMDVEDLARLGRRKAACPYYAARAALLEADLVLLPYSALLAQARRPIGTLPAVAAA